MGKDGYVRGAILKVPPEGRYGPTRIQRPLQRLHPLEGHSATPDQESVCESISENDDGTEEPEDMTATVGVGDDAEEVATVCRGHPTGCISGQRLCQGAKSLLMGC